jgi:hypothetical protein
MMGGAMSLLPFSEAVVASLESIFKVDLEFLPFQIFSETGEIFGKSISRSMRRVIGKDYLWIVFEDILRSQHRSLYHSQAHEGRGYS